MIEGRLVHLRAREVTDIDDNARWSSDRELLELFGDRYERSHAASADATRLWASAPLSSDDPRFAVETKGGAHIGNTRLYEVTPEHGSARFAIMIGERAYWDRGYGSDAVLTLVRFAFDEMNLRRIDLETYAFNTRAIAAYHKCGFVEEGRRRQACYARGARHDVVMMSVLRGELKEDANA